MAGNPDDKKISQLPENPVVLDTDEFSAITPRTDGSIGYENVKTPGWKLKQYTNTDPVIAGQARFDDGKRNAPSIAHYLDTDTGIWFPVDDTLCVGTAGVETITIDPANNAIIGPEGPVLNDSRDGFLYLPTMAGAPTALPRQYADKSPIVVDTVNNVVFVYSGGAWRPLVPSNAPSSPGVVVPPPVTRLDALDDVLAKGASLPKNGDALVWDAASNKWKPARSGMEVTIRPNRLQAYPNPASLPAGHLILTIENGVKEIAVVSAAKRIEILYSDSELLTKIASSSLFQGVRPDKTELAKLPAPAPTNKGFYWTWTGPASTPIVPADFTNGGGFTATLQVGDWLQSDGTKYVHVPSDLMSKLRWISVGSFRTWTDTNFEVDTLVVHNGKFYRATAAVTTGDPAPDVGGPWVDITPSSSIRTSSDYDNTNPPTDGQAIVWDEATKKFVPKTLGQPIVYYGAGAYDTANVIAPLFGMAADTVPDPNTWIPAAGDLYIDTQTGIITLLTGGGTNPASPTGNRADPVTGGTTTTVDIGGDGFIPLFKGNYSVGSNTGGVYTAPVNPAEGDIWVDKNVNPPVFKVYRAGAWVQVDPGITHLGLLSDLANVDVGRINPPQQGDALVYNKLEEKWISGAVPAHLTEYDPNTHYAAGTTVYFKGGLFEAKTETSGVSPEFRFGDVWFFHRKFGAGTGDWIGPVSFEHVNIVTDEAVAPTLTYVATDLRPHWTLQYVDDDNYSIWQWELSMVGWTPGTALPAPSWRRYDTTFNRPGAVRLWRNYSAPTSHVGDCVVWIYDDPKGTNKPHYRDLPWMLRPIRSDLISMHDVKAEDPADQSILIWNTATSYWEARPNPSYTKLETDAKLQVVAQGLSHGVSVNAIQNTPPVSPLPYDYYLVGTAGAGAWAGQNNNLAWWDGAAWKFATPSTGDTHLVESAGSGGENWNWNGTAWVKVANAAVAGSASSLFIVGDIKQSVLTENQFIAELGVVEGRKWVLADGRNVAGTRYATLTGNSTVPDLRGAYLRMAGQNNKASWTGGALNTWQEDTTRAPRNNALTGTTNTTGNHTHTLRRYLPNNWSDGWEKLLNYAAGGFRTINGGQANYSETDFPVGANGNHTHSVTINGGGDTETRPKTYCANFFIKVDN